MSRTAVLAFVVVGATGIASAQTAPPPALVQELNVVNVSRVQEKAITPGVAWVRRGVQLGIGVGVPSHQSKPLLMLSSTIEF